MKILKRILLALLLLIILAICAGFIFIRHLGQQALPDYNTDLTLQGLHAPVEVYRDSFAIPHVYAQDEHDLYMAVGYLSAQDRLWQMDMLRHVSEGRLSEIFGHGYIETDYLLRSLRFTDKSERIIKQADSLVILAINAYADGINQYLDQNKNNLPFEFTLLGYKPEKWKPYQTVNMIGYMAWDLQAGWSEILLSEIQKTVDSVHYQQILPDLLRMKPYVYAVGGSEQASSGVLPDLLLHNAELRKLGTDVLESSNNWAVSGKKSTTGMPLLANDMHLGLSVPGIWYQMHQVVAGKLNVTGLVLPCTPVVVCGHNDSIAWGMTNTYVDNLDFYEEKINPEDSNQYEYNGTWRNFEIRKTVIKVSDGSQVERTLKFTQRGPVVSSMKKIKDRTITMHWAGDEMSDEFRTVMLLNRAGNWNDFKEALTTFTSISQNIVYADKKGNIGLFCAAGIPIRNRDIAIGILPGETGKYDWQGYVPFDELPFLFNPVDGYVASANNATAPPDYPYHIGSWYSLPDRYERITEMLRAKDKLSIEDFKTIQLDQKSKLAEKYMPVILEALSTDEALNPTEKRAFEMLKAWDYTMNAQSAAATIFETLYLNFIRCTFEDELGKALFDKFYATNSINRRAVYQIMDAGTSVWLDDVTTSDKTEDITDIITEAFSKTISDLASRLDDNPAAWEWGSVHRLELAHPLSAKKILDQVFDLNRGPFPVGGSFHTVSAYSYSSNASFDAGHGSSHRHIFDLYNWDNSLTVIPTGTSGIPASEHYCDQTDLYVQGMYHHDYFTKDKIVASARYHMKFNL
jgi:penicillin amidase